MTGDRAKPVTIVLDLDGVLYLDDEGIPGAGDSMRRLCDEGHQLLFVTNNATKTAEMVVAHVTERTGFQPEAGSVVTSGMATARHLAGSIDRVFVLGERALEDQLRAVGMKPITDWQDAEAVVVGLDRGLTYARLASAVLAVGGGARFVATNVDGTYPTPHGLYPGGGSLAAAVTAATGVVPEVCGKPEAPMREMVRSLVDRAEVWVVGDRIETDLAMGAAEGWRTALVLTGVDGEGDVAGRGIVPDLVVRSIADFPEALAQARN